MPRQAATIVALLSTLLLMGMGAQPVASAAAARASSIAADPPIGPHAREDALHASDKSSFTAATSSVSPRRAVRAAASAAAQGAAATGSAGTLSREVLGFAPYWALQAGQQSGWNYSLMSTVAYFGLTMNGDGSFASDLGSAQFGSANFVDMASRAHAVGDRVVIVIKAFNNAAICQITSDSSQAAIANTIQAIRSKTLDGVNIDFEGSNMTCPNGQSLQSGLTAFASQMATQVHQAVNGSSVTIDTYSGSASWDLGEFKIDDLARTPIDAMFVMAYDMNFSNMSDANGHNHAGPTAPLNAGALNWAYNDTSAVQQYLVKAPASKIILGVPYYGYKWCTADSSDYSQMVYTTVTLPSGATAVVCPHDTASDYIVNPTAETYARVAGDFQCMGSVNGVNRRWDSNAQSWVASWWSPASGDPCGGNRDSWRELYYDDATSLGLKYDLVNANNLAGTGMWALGYDGTSPDLWNEIAQKFVAWKSWVPLGGSLSTGPAAASQGTGKLDVFAAGQDHGLYQKSFDGTSWSSWQPLGGRLNSDPAAVSWGSGRLDVFARGSDHALYHMVYDGTWHYWERLAANMSTGPAVSSWGPNRLDVFGAGVDGQLYHKTFNGTTWSDWEALGGHLSSAPAAVSWGSGRIDVVARGMDSALYHKSFTGTGWSDWEYLGGSLSAGAAISSASSNHLDVFAPGRDGTLYQKVFDGTTWGPWQWLGGRVTASPASVSWAPGRIDVFARSTDLALYQKSYSSP